MKKKKYSDAQIMGILKQAESGVPVSELCHFTRDELCQFLQMAIEVRGHALLSYE